MADYIKCKNCDSTDCNGCNIKILETMLYERKFDCLMNGNRSINQSADVVPVRHGRWDFKVGMNIHKERICTVCKKHIESNFWNFCPNCGAKMDGELNE